MRICRARTPRSRTCSRSGSCATAPGDQALGVFVFRRPCRARVGAYPPDQRLARRVSSSGRQFLERNNGATVGSYKEFQAKWKARSEVRTATLEAAGQLVKTGNAKLHATDDATARMFGDSRYGESPEPLIAGASVLLDDLCDRRHQTVDQLVGRLGVPFLERVHGVLVVDDDELRVPRREPERQPAQPTVAGLRVRP